MYMDFREGGQENQVDRHNSRRIKAEEEDKVKEEEKKADARPKE